MVVRGPCREEKLLANPRDEELTKKADDGTKGTRECDLFIYLFIQRYPYTYAHAKKKRKTKQKIQFPLRSGRESRSRDGRETLPRIRVQGPLAPGHAKLAACVRQ